MIYCYLILILFLWFYQLFATDSVVWQSLFFTFIFGTFAALSFIAMLKGKDTFIYLGITLIMLFLTIRELLCLNMNLEQYTAFRSGPPAYTLGILAVCLYVFWKLSKNIKWKHGVKKHGN